MGEKNGNVPRMMCAHSQLFSCVVISLIHFTPSENILSWDIKLWPLRGCAPVTCILPRMPSGEPQDNILKHCYWPAFLQLKLWHRHRFRSSPKSEFQKRYWLIGAPCSSVCSTYKNESKKWHLVKRQQDHEHPGLTRSDVVLWKSICSGNCIQP